MIDISIQPLRGAHPEQLGDFFNKMADLFTDEIAHETEQPKDEIRQMIYEQYRALFGEHQDNFEQRPWRCLQNEHYRVPKSPETIRTQWPRGSVLYHRPGNG